MKTFRSGADVNSPSKSRVSSQTAAPSGGGETEALSASGVNRPRSRGTATIATCGAAPSDEASRRANGRRASPAPRGPPAGIFARGEQIGVAAAELKRFPSDQQFDPRVAGIGGQPLAKAKAAASPLSASRTSSASMRTAAGEIDRPAIVRIDEAEIPKLLPLIDVGHARRGQLQEDLRQRAVQSPANHLR